MSDTKKPRAVKPEGNGNSSASGRLVGLDIDYGFTKIIRDDGEQVMFPSAVAANAPTMAGRLGDVQADDEVVVGRTRRIAGKRAIGHNDRFSNLPRAQRVVRLHRLQSDHRLCKAVHLARSLGERLTVRESRDGNPCLSHGRDSSIRTD